MTTDSNHERAALSARKFAEKVHRFVIIYDNSRDLKRLWDELERMIALRDAAIEQRARLEGEVAAHQKIASDLHNRWPEIEGYTAHYSGVRDEMLQLAEELESYSPTGRSLVEKREAEIQLEAFRNGHLQASTAFTDVIRSVSPDEKNQWHQTWPPEEE